MVMKRREFLMSAAAVAGLAGSSRLWAAQAANPKLARIAVSSRNFDAIIKMGNGASNPAARTLDPLDFAQMIADTYGVHNIELQHAHFMSTEPAYLKSMKDRVGRSRSQIAQITTEFFNSHASSTAASLRQSIDLAKQWIDHAEALGCPRVHVTAGHLSEAVRASAIDALTKIATYAKAHKVTVSIENMDNGVVPTPPPPPPAAPPKAAPAAEAAGGAAPAAGRRGGGGGGARAGGGGGAAAPAAGAAAPAGGGGGGRGNAPQRPASWQVVSEVAKASGVAVTPNFLGFPSEAERVAGLKVLYPMANGNSHVAMSPGKIDLAAGIKIAQDTGYRGLFTIVTDGTGDGKAATKATLDELLKLI
jgi:sugar phosphate isomerase/epimerase